MTFANINGQEIYFEDSGGEGAPIILAHGFLMDADMFAPQVAALSPTYRVITWDERGFGRTKYDGNPFTYWDSAKDCLALLTHLGIQRAVVGGMSQGGFLSLRVALTAPERVRALVLLDTEAGKEPEEQLAGYRQMLDTWESMGPVDPLCEAIASIIINEPTENAKWIAKWKGIKNVRHVGECLLDRDNILSRLSEIRCPAIVIHGIDDNAITMERGELLAEGLSGAVPIVKVPGAHAANLTHPAAVNEALLAFLPTLPA